MSWVMLCYWTPPWCVHLRWIFRCSLGCFQNCAPSTFIVPNQRWFLLILFLLLSSLFSLQWSGGWVLITYWVLHIWGSLVCVFFGTVGLAKYCFLRILLCFLMLRGIFEAVVLPIIFLTPLVRPSKYVHSLSTLCDLMVFQWDLIHWNTI